MDILQLDNGLKAINQTGVTLNLEEKYNIYIYIYILLILTAYYCIINFG